MKQDEKISLQQKRSKQALIRLGRRQLAGVLAVSSCVTLCLPAQVYAEEPAAEAAMSEGHQTASKPVNSVDSLINLYNAARDETEETKAPETGDLSYVNVDETLYVNLDAYGAMTKANVVKGISSSKKMEYTDYGDYTKVLNMSNDEKLMTAPGKVSFQLDGTGKKFFIEGQMKPENVQLPWNLTVSYKKNGVPVEASELAGASGVIEINIHAEPNPLADDYMRNNMILAAVVPVDESKIYSVDAPGSQTQSIGETTGVMFTALPGEARDFTARLGTDSYESIGVLFMMIPGTTDSLDNITDLKHLRDTWRDSGNAMYDGLDDLLRIAESLRGEMEGLGGSLRLADSAREQLYQAKDSIFNTNDKALADLNQLGVEMQKLIPYVSSVQPKLWQLNNDMNSVVGMLSGMQSSLSYLARGLDKLADGAFDTKGDLGDLVSRLTGVTGDLTDQTGSYQTRLTQMIKEIDAILAALPPEGEVTAEELSAYWNEAADALEERRAEKEGAEDDAATPSEADRTATGSNAHRGSSVLDSIDHDALSEALVSFAQEYGISGDVSEEDYAVLADSAVSVKQMSKALKSLRTQLIELKEKLRNMQSLPSDMNALTGSVEDLLAGAGRTGTGAHYTVEDIQDSIAKIEQLNDTLNSLYPDIQSSLTQLQAILGQTGTSLNSATNALSLAQNTLRSVTDTADASLRTAISSSLSLIDKTLDLFDATGRIRSAGADAKGTLDEELDKFDNENNFLNMDPNAEKLSFTSAENKTPDSVQIILRTDEISVDDDDAEIMDAEKPAKNESIFTRIKNIFVKIIKAIAEAFQNA